MKGGSRYYERDDRNKTTTAEGEGEGEAEVGREQKGKARSDVGTIGGFLRDAAATRRAQDH